MLQLVHDVAQNWNNWSEVEAACYVLWRLTWIHPFEEGNGRTARAAAYYVLCTRYQAVLPGRRTLPDLIREDAKPYYDGLRSADEAWAEGRVDTRQLQVYLRSLLLKQFAS